MTYIESLVVELAMLYEQQERYNALYQSPSWSTIPIFDQASLIEEHDMRLRRIDHIEKILDKVNADSVVLLAYRIK